jgi:hypothetical protein
MIIVQTAPHLWTKLNGKFEGTLKGTIHRPYKGKWGQATARSELCQLTHKDGVLDSPKRNVNNRTGSPFIVFCGKKDKRGRVDRKVNDASGPLPTLNREHP